MHRLVAPIGVALLMAFFTQPLYTTAEGGRDLILMWLLIGIPFGVQKVCLWLRPEGCSIATAAGMVAVSLLIGGIIGIFVFSSRIIGGFAYLAVAIGRAVFRRKGARLWHK